MATAPSADIADTGSGSSEPDTGLSVFHCFPDLPAELQAAIWRQAFPRIWGHEFEFRWKLPDVDGVALFVPSAHLVQDTLPHRNLLSTCWDARREVLCSFVLLPVYTGFFDPPRYSDEDESEEQFPTAHVPFDKDFGIFCVKFDRVLPPPQWDGGLTRFLDIVSGDLPPEHLHFEAWKDRTFDFSRGFHFGDLVERIAFVVELPDYPGMSDNEDFELWYTDSHFIMFSWALLDIFQPIDDDKVYVTHAGATDRSVRLSPTFHAWLHSIDTPKFCTRLTLEDHAIDDAEADILDEINEFSTVRRICALELLASRLGLDEEDIWKDDHTLYTFEEIRDMADADASSEGGSEEDGDEASEYDGNDASEYDGNDASEDGGDDE